MEETGWEPGVRTRETLADIRCRPTCQGRYTAHRDKQGRHWITVTVPKLLNHSTNFIG